MPAVEAAAGLRCRIYALPLLGISLLCGAQPAETPAQYVADAADALATAIAAQRTQLEEDSLRRRRLIDDMLLPKFDLQTASRLILREHWNRAADAERERFVAAFYNYLVSSYGWALPAFTHETISVLPGEESVPGASALVRSRLRLADGSEFDVDFYLRRSERGWRIVDVIAEGISYIRTYRSDYGAEARRHGLAALTARLEDLATAADGT